MGIVPFDWNVISNHICLFVFNLPLSTTVPQLLKKHQKKKRKKKKKPILEAAWICLEETTAVTTKQTKLIEIKLGYPATLPFQ